MSDMTYFTTLKLTDKQTKALFFALWHADNNANDAPESHDVMYEGIEQIRAKLAKAGWEDSRPSERDST